MGNIKANGDDQVEPDISPHVLKRMEARNREFFSKIWRFTIFSQNFGGSRNSFSEFPEFFSEISKTH